LFFRKGYEAFSKMDFSIWSLSYRYYSRSSESSFACWALWLIWKLARSRCSHSLVRFLISIYFCSMKLFDWLNIDSSLMRSLLRSAILLESVISSCCWVSSSRCTSLELWLGSSCWSRSRLVVNRAISFASTNSCDLNSSTKLRNS